MRSLSTTELSHVSGGNVVEKNETVIVYQEPPVAYNPFIRNLAWLVIDVALRVLIESAFEDEYDDYYYCDGYYC